MTLCASVCVCFPVIGSFNYRDPSPGRPPADRTTCPLIPLKSCQNRPNVTYQLVDPLARYPRYSQVFPRLADCLIIMGLIVVLPFALISQCNYFCYQETQPTLLKTGNI